MESKSIVIHKGGKEEKYKLYVEDYVLSYLKYETGSLEFSEIYFYGTRQKEERKYIIYGAGRDKRIPSFDAYDLLEEIVCRLTQAGPVFMVREGEEVYQVKGFDIFYQDNEAMQSYMVDRQYRIVRQQPAVKEDRHQTVVTSLKQDSDKVETKPLHSHGMMSAQLGMILIILVAIVINSANSYDKMEQLNRSAEEVFFAIENQEADGTVSENYEPGAEIVVEREQDQESDSESNLGDESGTPMDTQEGEDFTSDEVKDTEEQNSTSGEKEQEGVGKETETGKEEPSAEEGLLKEVVDTAGQNESDDEETEALSRNVTRYYEVERGDTLYTICQKIYGDTSQVKKICELNDISDPDRIRFGQKIILP